MIGTDVSAQAQFKPNRRDFAVMAAMVLVYLLVALYNLGSFKVPQTFWQPLKAGESFTVEMAKNVRLERIYYYCGINERRYEDAKFSILYDDGVNGFRLLTVIKKGHGNLEICQGQCADPQTPIIADPPGGTLNEIALVERGSRLPIRGIRVSAQVGFPGRGT